MAAAPVYQTSTSATGTTTVVINKPASTAQNDLLIAVVSANSFTGSWTAPSGWSAAIESGLVNGNSPTTTIFSKVAGGSEPSTYTFTFSAAVATSGRITRITGADTTTPVDSHTSGSAANGLTSIAIGSVVPTLPNALILEIIQVPTLAGTTTYACTNVTSFTEAYLDTGVGEFRLAYGTSSAAGTAAATFSKQFNNAWWAAALSIAPLNTGTPATATMTVTVPAQTPAKTFLPAALALTAVAFAATASGVIKWKNGAKSAVSAIVNQAKTP